MNATMLKIPRYLIITLAIALLGQVKTLAVVEIYNTVTNFNWVCPTDVTNLQVECWGGGGAGGAAARDTGATANAGGGGAAAGAYARKILVPVSPGSNYNITIPAAATSPAATLNGVRNDGSAVTFTGDSGVTVTAAGGQGGTTVRITGATATSGSRGIGSTTGCDGDVLFAGGSGGSWSSGNGAAGGGGPSDLAAGGVGSTSATTAGAGATGSNASHDGGIGGTGRNGVGSGGGASAPGGGGGGAKVTSTPTQQSGGGGGRGQIMLTYTTNVPPAVLVVKTNNSDNLNLGTSWVGGVTPGVVSAAKWDSTVTSANTTVLGANLTWQGIIIADPAGLITINAGNTLTLGGGSTNINLSAATANLTLNCTLALGSANVWDVGAARILTLGGVVSGSQAVTMQGAGTNIFSVANTYTGDTTVSTGTLQLGAPNVIPDGSGKGNVTVNGALDLNTFSETINGLNGAGTVDTVAGGTPTLTIGSNNAAGTFSGVLQNTVGTLSLIKSGTNRQVLTGNSTLSGTVAINEGWLAVGADAGSVTPLANVTGITNANGTTLSGNGVSVTVAAPVTLLGGTVTFAPISGALNPGSTTARPFNLTGGISGNANVIFKGVNLNNAYGTIGVGSSSYTGNTLMTCDNSLVSSFSVAQTNNNEIIVRLLADNALPTTTVLTMDGDVGVGSVPGRFCDLNLNGKNQTLAGITNIPRGSLRNQRVINPSGSIAATLTINNTADYEFSGQLGGSGGSLSTGTGNNFSLVKSGSGILYLSRSAGNTYTNNTTVNGGTLRIRTASFFTNSTVSVAAGAVLQLDFAGTDNVAGFVTNGVSLAPGIYSSNNVAPFIAGSGSVQILAAGPSGPGTITNSVSGNMLTLTWPAGETWRLVGQTNNLSTGLNASPGAWFEVPGGIDGSNSITINPGSPSVFYKLVSP